jgi:putative transposase
MPAKKYIVDCTAEEREHVLQVIQRGKHSARKITRARIVLKAAESWPADQRAAALAVGVATVERPRKRFVEAPLAVLTARPRLGARPKLDGKQAAHGIALACSKAPDGHAHWTVRLLAGQVVE